jgi:cytochrome c peroxidase
VPLGLPPVQLPAFVTADAVALGDALFQDARLSATGKLACASCHVPGQDYAGGSGEVTAAGKPNLRRAPTIANLAWKREFGWDGRSDTLDDFLQAHIPGQLGQPLDAALHALAADAGIQARLARVGGAPDDAALRGLEAFALTRFDGDSPWDRAERAADPPAELLAGYKLFMGKARCAGCHPPPLYTDFGYHRVVRDSQAADKGRGFVEPARTNAFATPTVRGAAVRMAYFHGGVIDSKGGDKGHDNGPPSLEAVVAEHVAASSRVAQAGSIDPLLDKPLALSASETQQLLAFVRALTRAGS